MADSTFAAHRPLVIDPADLQLPSTQPIDIAALLHEGHGGTFDPGKKVRRRQA